MYRIEEFKNRIAMKGYMKSYINGESFLEYCEKCTGYDQIWSCPLYDFNPEEYRRNYKYLYVIGKRITFEQTAGSGEEQKERERYMSQVCLKEKDILSKKMQELLKSYPDSVVMSVGSCHVCSRCSQSISRGCRYSEEIRNFIESIGGTVGESVGDLLVIELKWMKKKLPGYFTLINGFLTNNSKVVL